MNTLLPSLFPFSAGLQRYFYHTGEPEILSWDLVTGLKDYSYSRGVSEFKVQSSNNLNPLKRV